MEQITEIINGCIAGKNKYQGMLYKLFARKMYGICLYYSKDYTEAEDILQEGFIKIFKNIKQYQSKGPIEAWMRKIMVNTALERFRKQSYLYSVSDVYDYTEDFSYEDALNEISAKDLMKMIQELSPKYRMVFNLYAIEGYSHKEIGEKLNISEGTSKSNLARARTILQNKVKKYYSTDIKSRMIV